MKNQGRLTAKYGEGQYHMKCNQMCSDWDKCNPDECQSFYAIRKLGEYEDAIENGTLVFININN